MCKVVSKYIENNIFNLFWNMFPKNHLTICRKLFKNRYRKYISHTTCTLLCFPSCFGHLRIWVSSCRDFVGGRTNNIPVKYLYIYNISAFFVSCRKRDDSAVAFMKENTFQSEIFPAEIGFHNIYPPKLFLNSLVHNFLKVKIFLRISEVYMQSVYSWRDMMRIADVR